ncbi:MAG: AAA family ATPase [ANME-2 cluster archaeon]|nr:AAA family ATPase [ANME-2 cluster archaeon]MBC2700312.1 AAA family ATPase [ANME-2 cluster archaeon]MBC2706142.1 AAA family ATPase [ANME-2 cluster archaeon]MBC2748414.1 AAA family ATPase [ANME-2 cluster archaeon]MBC2761855.1 AAA family ATPase [ANME-2 cluster archaeon]
MKIAITGKGGVGKTTLAGTLARLLARDGMDVLAIDADPDMNLASALGIDEPPLPLTEYEDMIDERAGGPGGMFKLNPKVDDVVERFGVVGPDGVRMLVMGTVDRGGSGCMCPASSFLRALLRHVVLKESSVVIMDMEAGIEHLGRGTTRGIDLMIVVVEPGARSLETAERIKRLGTDIGVTKFAAVINKAGEEDLGAVEYRLENMGIPVLGTIPYDSSLVKADLAGRSPVEEGGAAMAAIEGIKDRLVLI